MTHAELSPVSHLTAQNSKIDAKAAVKAKAKAKANAYLESIPADMAGVVLNNRVLSAAEAAEMCGFSLAHWRRMYRTGQAPKPLMLGKRKLGWRYSTLTEFTTRNSD